MGIVTRIAITGGPCAGKTTALKVIRAELSKRGFKVITIPEPATELISNGVTPWECSSSEEYQRCQMEIQLVREAMYERAARGMDYQKILLVFDRGMLDNKCYMTENEFARVLVDLQRTEDELRANYDAVFHLVSAAKGAPEFYSTDTNVIRYETLEEAAALDDRFILAWQKHPHFRIIENRGSFDDKLQNLLQQVREFLGES